MGKAWGVGGGRWVWGNFQITSSNSITHLILNALFGERGALPHAKKRKKTKIKCHVKPIRSSYFSNDIITYGGFIHAIYNLLFLHLHLMFRMTTIEF
jgi:hypothetical protein